MIWPGGQEEPAAPARHSPPPPQYPHHRIPPPLIIILSAFNGFESLVKSLYSSFYPELRIGPVKGKTIRLTQQQLNQLRGIDGIAAISLVAEERALLQNGSLQTVVNIKGVDNQYAMVSGLPGNMYRGVFSTGDGQKPGLVMGVGVEQMLGCYWWFLLLITNRRCVDR